VCTSAWPGATIYDQLWGRYARRTAREVLGQLPPLGSGTLLDVDSGTGTLPALARARFSQRISFPVLGQHHPITSTSMRCAFGSSLPSIQKA
jgi:hypothetical protein